MDVEKIRAWLRANILQALVICAVCAGMVFCVWVRLQGNNKEFAVHGPRLIKVEEGMSTADIAQLLHDRRLVKSPLAFRLEARLNGLATKLQAGVYQIDGGLSNAQIVDVLVKGRIQLVQFMLPEGYNVVKTAQKLEAEGLGSAEKFIAAAKNFAPYEYMRTDNPDVIYKAEGFIFPATYDFPVGLSEEGILHIMVNQFDHEVQTAGILKEAQEQKKNLRDVVNLAAMVEMEAVYADEQPRIAGVFLKRLEIGMPIQSDTTIQYILGAQKELITYADTEIQNPYNTYQNPGLPPGPIASPGLSAIKAVLEPERTDYLYFVAEKDGHHRFSKTYSEHLRAIDEIG